MTTTPPVPAQPEHPFLILIPQLHRGMTMAELAEAMEHCIESVRKTGLKQTLRLEIDFSPGNKGEVTQIETIARVNEKLQKSPQRSTVFFLCADGTLSRDDPKQMELIQEAASNSRVVQITDAKAQ